MGSSTSHDVDSSESLIARRRADQQTLNTVVTEHTAKTWIRGCHLLAFCQEVILMRGPAVFVMTCLDSNAPKMEFHERIEQYQSVLKKYILAVLFVVVAPFSLPTLAVSQFMPHDFDFEKVGDQRLQWSHEHGFFKIFQEGDDFESYNVRLDLGMLREELANSTAERSGSVLYLRDQEVQAQLTLMHVELAVGVATLLIALLVYFVRTRFENSSLVKWFVINVLHFQWFGVKFPRLKFTSAKLLWGHVELYKLVPCVWFSIMASFVIVVPLCVFYYEKAGVLEKDRWNLMSRVIPGCVVAAYTIGTLYLQAASSTFLQWLSTPLEYALNDRLLEIEKGGLFVQIATRVGYCTITVAEAEAMASMRSAELWQKCVFLRRCVKKGFTEVPIKEISTIEESMRKGRWYQANKKLGELVENLQHSHFSEVRKYVANGRFITNIHIVDTASDASFEVDLPAETCARQRPDGRTDLVLALAEKVHERVKKGADKVKENLENLQFPHG